MSSDDEWKAGADDDSEPLNEIQEPEPDPADISEVEDEYAPKKAKRSKTSKQPAKRSRKQGRLSQLLQLPTDVSHAILSYLDPADIMNMSRANKFFRTLLYNRQNEKIWLEAVKNIEKMPNPPIHMSLPAWVALLFDKRCYACGKVTTKVDFMLRKRLCTACGKTLVVSNTDLFLNGSGNPRSAEEWNVINRESEMTCRLIDRHMSLGGLYGGAKWAHLRYSGIAWFKPDLEKMRPLVQDYANGKESAEDWLAKHPELQKLDKIQAKIRAGSWDFIKVCDAYVTHTAVTRRAANANATQRRRRAIEVKLIAKGVDIEKLPAEFWQDKAVAQARDLSDRIWKNLEPKLDVLVPKMIARRKAETRWDKVSSLTANFRYGSGYIYHMEDTETTRDVKDPKQFCPDIQISNIMQLPSFAPLMDQEDDPTEEQWAAAVANLQTEVDHWREKVRAHLKSMMPEALVALAGTVDPLLRVDCVWRVADEEREDVKDYGALIKNIPLTSAFVHPMFQLQPTPELNRHASGYFIPDNFEDLAFDEKSSDAIRRWIAITPVKPEDASATAMSALGRRFYVKKSQTAPKPSWFDTFHIVTRHLDSKPTDILGYLSDAEHVEHSKQSAVRVPTYPFDFGDVEDAFFHHYEMRTSDIEDAMNGF